MRHNRRMPFVTLLAGGAVLGLVGIFVRLAGADGVGPFAAAFWRMAMATPLLVVWAWWSERAGAASPPSGPVRGGLLPDWSLPGLIALAATAFAGDLILFHLGLRWSTVANATLESNLAPLVVTLALWALTRVPPRPSFVVALVAALLGALLVIGAHLGHRRSLLGDLCGSASALFYAAYQIGVQQARQRLGTLPLMAWISAGATLALWPMALLEGQLWPHDAMGWVWLVGLALLVQIGGQVVIAHAVKHLEPARASVGLLVQPATSALYAWAFLGERLGALQAAGGALVLAGIYLARR